MRGYRGVIKGKACEPTNHFLYIIVIRASDEAMSDALQHRTVKKHRLLSYKAQL